MATIEKRVSKVDGSAQYRVRVRLRGFPPQTASFKRLTDAKKWVQQTEAAIREGRHFKTVESRKHTLQEAIDRYLKFVLPSKKPNSQKDQSKQLVWWAQSIGYLSLADVTPAVIAEQRDKLSQGKTPKGNLRTPATVNRYLAILSHLFTLSVKEWGWAYENPVLKVTRLKEPRGRIRFLSDDERTNLLDACKQSDSTYLYTVVVLALSTGARRNEILNLKWQDLSISRSVITLHETKNGEIRVLPLTHLALELIKGHAKVRSLRCDYVFPAHSHKKPIDITTPWETALRRAEIKDFRFHDLRHSAASYLAMNGASLAEIAEILGHKTLQMVKRYAHLSAAHTSKVVERMNEKIFGI
jgi:integrase